MKALETTGFRDFYEITTAEEMTTYTQQNVLDQAGTAMLAQANERPQNILQLLQS